MVVTKRGFFSLKGIIIRNANKNHGGRKTTCFMACFDFPANF